MFFGCLFQDRFLIVLGSILGSILEPSGFPNGVYVGGFGGCGVGGVGEARMQLEAKRGM